MSNDSQQLWNKFFLRHQLSLAQQDIFQDYYERLVFTNKLHNITAITDLKKVLNDHFDDSLALSKSIDCSTIQGLGDIGTGAGFPSIPLKIMYPQMSLVLIEVNAKKRAFLQDLIIAFNLSHTIVSELDWRTFLRKTDYPLDTFCARASVQPEELIRMFKPSSPYKDGSLVYWASGLWQPSNEVFPFIKRRYEYTVGEKKRVLVFMSL